MQLRSAIGIGLAAAAACAVIAFVVAPSLRAPVPPPAAASKPPAKPEAKPANTAAAKPDTRPQASPAQPAPTAPPAQGPSEGLATKPTDPFGVDVTLAARPIVYVKGSGTWDKAFPTISGSLKKVESYLNKEGLKADGLPMTIFTATDDTGFDYEAALPIAELPKTPPHGDVAFGQSPAGHALKFVHRGSYEALDDTYEAITNYLDDKRLESKNLLIEQYVTDPTSSDEKNLVINVLVLVN